ncbi:glycosyltransferase [Aestuariivirga sp.]|uniref:glycosyltransferase n=1 Tax=Aestuariivirga sp. TaxID=2650926 RepID=UPI003BAD1C76
MNVEVDRSGLLRSSAPATESAVFAERAEHSKGEVWYASFEALDDWGSGLATYCRQVIRAAEVAGRPIRLFQIARGKTAISRTKRDCVTHVFVPDATLPEMTAFGYRMNLSWQFAEAVCQEIDRSGAPRSIEVPDGFALGYFLLQRKLVGDPRLKNVPVLICAHTPVGIIDQWNGGDVYALPNWWVYRAEKWCCKAADGIITMSSLVEGLMRERGYIDVDQAVSRSAYPFLVNQTTREARNSTGELKIGMASRMVDWKGLREALTLVRATETAGQSLVLELCGEVTSDFAHAKRDFADVFSSGRAVYLGNLTGAELNSKRREWDCQIHPSQFDNYPFSVLESLASGLPCLISQGNGISEVLTGRLRELLVCDFKNPADVLDKLRNVTEAAQLLRNAELPVLDSRSYFKTRDSFVAEILETQRARALFPFVSAEQAKADLIPKQPVPSSPSGARLTVVIPYYNLGTYLRSCVESILRSTIKADIIIVNDGSTDRPSIKALEPYRRHERVRVLDVKNGGVARARNVGVEEAATEFVALLDADDTVEPSYYAKALHVLDTYDNVGFVGCWSNDFEDESGATIRYWPTYNAEPVPNIVSNNTNCQALIYRRSLYLEAGRHDPMLRMFLDDWDGMLGMLEGGYFGVMLPEPLFNYRQRPGSVFRSNFGLWKANFASIMRKRHLLLERNASEALLFSNANGPNHTFHLLGHTTAVNVEHHHYSAPVSKMKGRLVKLWEALPRSVQKRIEPFADYIDSITR